jgi:tetratricopeptide (TPR) repeat protein
VTEPPEGSSVDDRVDALALYAQLLRKRGDSEGAREATGKQLTLLEAAAAAAPSPETAATFDYTRMNAYLALGRGDEAVAMLQKRAEQLPDAYEPVARLAQTLLALRRYEPARVAAEAAVAKSYGPRQLGYLRMLADVLHALKDRPAEINTLSELVAAYGKLGDKQRNHPKHKAGLKAAEQRLARLKAAR